MFLLRATIFAIAAIQAAAQSSLATLDPALDAKFNQLAAQLTGDNAASLASIKQDVVSLLNSNCQVPSTTTTTSTSTTSSSASTSTASCAAGWIPKGCYTDDTSARGLLVQPPISGSLTIEKCQAACYSAGYSLAGVEYGQECYCDTQLRHNQGPAPDGNAQCNFACQGNPAETCGGSNRLNIYSYVANPCLTATATTTTTSATATPTCTGPYSWVALGCYTDNTSARSLSVRTNVNSATNENCQAACYAQGYTLAGTEYYGECYCDVSLRFGATYASDQSTCNTACSGNTAEMCGGSDHISVFSYQQICSSSSSSTSSTSSSSSVSVVPTTSTTSSTTSSATSSTTTSATSSTSTSTTSSTTTSATSSTSTSATSSSTSSTSSSTTSSSSSSPTSTSTSSSTSSSSSSSSSSPASSSTSTTSSTSTSASSTTTSSSSTSSTTSTSSLSTTSSSTSTSASSTATSYVNQTTCNGKKYSYQQLAGYGFNPSNATDMFGDTIGGIGSGIALDQTAWTKLANGSYTGVLWALPDRGWNTQGTYNYQPRVHKFNILFTPKPAATVASPSGPNLIFTYVTSILFFGPDGVTPTTGLDASGSGFYSYAGFPDLPMAVYSGDGFGGAGTQHQRIAIDAESIVLNADGSFWISDEYGPYVYRFSAAGIMLQAIRPNDAIIPMRNGAESFSANTQFGYINGGAGDDVSPADNPTGRDNNHGFEGLTISGDGKSLYALLQAATNQEGGLTKQTQRYARFVKYDLTNPSAPVYAAEWVVPLPLYVDPTAKAAKNPKAAAMSEIFHISGNQFLILSRDSSAGAGQSATTSVYRQVDVFDITGATNIAGTTFDCTTCAIASTAGVLNAAITPATYCSFLDFNVNSQLNRFGVHNGGLQDKYLLNEKWESLGLVPVDGASGADGQFFLFSLSDNDFITQMGHLNGGAFTYADISGYNLDSQALVFQIQLPAGVTPFAGA